MTCVPALQRLQWLLALFFSYTKGYSKQAKERKLQYSLTDKGILLYKLNEPTTWFGLSKEEATEGTSS